MYVSRKKLEDSLLRVMKVLQYSFAICKLPLPATAWCFALFTKTAETPILCAAYALLTFKED